MTKLRRKLTITLPIFMVILLSGCAGMDKQDVEDSIEISLELAYSLTQSACNAGLMDAEKCMYADLSYHAARAALDVYLETGKKEDREKVFDALRKLEESVKVDG